MGVGEVEAGEGVGRGVTGLLRLWKCVEMCEKKVGQGNEEVRKRKTHPCKNQTRKDGAPDEERQTQNLGEERMSHPPHPPIQDLEEKLV